MRIPLSADLSSACKRYINMAKAMQVKYI